MATLNIVKVALTVDGRRHVVDSERVNFQEVQSAQRRVGRTLRERLQWALDFTGRQLDQLTADEWSALRLQFLAFSDVVIPPGTAHSRWVRRMLTDEPWGALWMERGGRRGPGRPSARADHLQLGPVVKLGDPLPRLLPTRQKLQESQRKWRRLVDELMSPRCVVSIGPFAVNLVVSRSHGRPEARPVALEPEGSALLALANLLGVFAHLIRECKEPSCHRRFVAGRRGQKFCGRVCQSEAAVAAYRKRRANESRRRSARVR
jgi:hypothetical protein